MAVIGVSYRCTEINVDEHRYVSKKIVSLVRDDGDWLSIEGPGLEEIKVGDVLMLVKVEK